MYRELLWQEGYTVHSTRAEAEKLVLDTLDIYKKLCEDLLALPVTKGISTESERSVGAMYSTALEVILPVAGRGMRAAAAHNMGQNAATKFGIRFQSAKHVRELAWLTVWTFSFRALGLMLMVHGDDKGIVLPPKIAPVQVMMIPAPGKAEERDKIVAKLKEIENELSSVKVRCKIDVQPDCTAQWKHNLWEVKGVPLRVELSGKDLLAGEVSLVRRDTDEKVQVKWGCLKETIQTALAEEQKAMFESAKKRAAETVVNVMSWEQCKYYINQRKVCVAPWYDRYLTPEGAEVRNVNGRCGCSQHRMRRGRRRRSPRCRAW